MRKTHVFTAVIEREGDGYVALCPQLDVASQGETVAEARANLKEALELFLETASKAELSQRLRDEVYVTQLEIAVG
ncbi:MAG: type II toxin-antitoxin system HicB family antitoxin [SAR324 cluster bacterium]|nr:type II toxin-antitoxin system HicB family antitoxin [SAR324 cluster bacterium]